VSCSEKRTRHCSINRIHAAGAVRVGVAVRALAELGRRAGHRAGSQRRRVRREFRRRRVHWRQACG
jgi:hypothetical protein